MCRDVKTMEKLISLKTKTISQNGYGFPFFFLNFFFFYQKLNIILTRCSTKLSYKSVHLANS